MASGGNGLPCSRVRRTRAQQYGHRAQRHKQWPALGSVAAQGQGFGSHRRATGLKARCRALMWLTTGAWGKCKALEARLMVAQGFAQWLDRGSAAAGLRARMQGTGAQGKCVWCGTKMSRVPLFISRWAVEGSKEAEEPNFAIIAKFKLQFPTCRITTKI